MLKIGKPSGNQDRNRIEEGGQSVYPSTHTPGHAAHPVEIIQLARL